MLLFLVLQLARSAVQEADLALRGIVGASLRAAAPASVPKLGAALAKLKLQALVALKEAIHAGRVPVADAAAAIAFARSHFQQELVSVEKC